MVGAINDLRNIANQDRRILSGADGDVLQFLDVLDRRIDRYEEVDVAEGNVARRGDGVGSGQGRDDFLGGDAGAAQTIGVKIDKNRAGAAPERRWRRNTRQGGEERPDGIQRGILELGDAARLAGEDELPDGDAARIKTHHERRHGARRHHGAGPVDVADRLTHGLRHVRPRVELELHDRRALDVLGLYVLDARDIKEVIFVIISQEAFHLAGIHAAIGLRDVNRGDVQGREDVLRHALEAENGT